MNTDPPPQCFQGVKIQVVFLSLEYGARFWLCRRQSDLKTSFLDLRNSPNILFLHADSGTSWLSCSTVCVLQTRQKQLPCDIPPASLVSTNLPDRCQQDWPNLASLFQVSQAQGTSTAHKPPQRPIQQDFSETALDSRWWKSSCWSS